LDAPVLKAVSDLVQGNKPILEEDLVNLAKYLTADEITNVKDHLSAKKIPDYWFRVLSNCRVIKEAMGPDDEPLLKAIEDIHVIDD
jgi:hypothetical protein